MSCKHRCPATLEGSNNPANDIRWCPDCGSLYVRYETKRGTISKKPKWFHPANKKEETK